MAKVHLNSASNFVISPYLNGKVCHNIISIITKIPAVTTN
jgi:hypothetical protein